MANNYGSLEGTMDANGILGGEIQFNGAGGKVKDVQVNDVSVVDANGIAKIDLTDYAKTEDIPADLADLQDDADHRTVTDAEKTEWSGKSNVSANPSTTTETLTGIEIDGTAYAIPSGDVKDVKVDGTSVVDPVTKEANIDLSGYAETTDIHNPTITIQKNGQNVDTFTLNQTANKVIDISVPTKTSDLQNDNSFITNTVDNLANYYLKSDTYTQTEVNNLISAAVNGRFEKVTTLPVSGEPNVIYLVPKTTALTNNVYDEYIWQDNAWELLGSTEIDLSNYVTTTDLSTALADYVTSSTFNTTITNYYTKTEIGNLLDDKVDKVSGKGLSTNDYDNTAKGIVDGVTNALAGKVDKVNGKGLSTEDYTTTEKNKLAGISTNANKVEASTTNGNIKIDDTETQVYDDSEIQDKIDETTTSISGNPISIPNLKSNQLAINPIITLEPIQDLHGQSKPYPASGGKNKLEIDVSGTIPSQVSVISDSDGNKLGFLINGTISSSSTVTVNLSVPLTVGTSYIISADGLVSGITVGVRDGVESSITITNTTPYAQFIPTGNCRIIMNIAAGTYLNVKVYSMIRLATETDATFAPYENICPISGYDKIEVLSGGNIWNEQWEQGYYKDGTGEKQSSTNYIRCKDRIRVIPNTSYYVYSQNALNFYSFNSNGEYVRAIGYNVTNTTITTGANDYFIVFNTAQSGVTSYGNNISINANPTDTSYHKTTDFSESLGQTVYGLTHEVRTGKAKKTRIMIDMGDIAWDYNSASNRLWFIAPAYNDAKTCAESEISSIMCDSYGTVSVNSITADATLDGVIGISQNGRIVVRNLSYTDASTFKTAMTGKKIVYELKESAYTEIQLTPHEISLLSEYAYISTNGTNISLDYHNGELASLADVETLGQTVENVVGYLEANNRGTAVNLKPYTSAEPYQFPNDGYVIVYGGSATSGRINVALRGNDGGNFGGIIMNVTSATQMQTTFVRKGMKAYLIADTTGATDDVIEYRALTL